jgi:imidazolonepropionase-like amidohydrolase
MRTPFGSGLSVAAALMVCACSNAAGAQDSARTIVLRASTILDGRGGRIEHGAIVVRGARIVEVARGARADSLARRADTVYNLGGATLMPGLIDAHVHFVAYFNDRGRVHTDADGDSPVLSTLAIADNLRRTLLGGVTTVQSIGSDDDAAWRDAVARGALAGPRILTSLEPIADPSLSPDSLRALVRDRKARGADVIKIFASKSIRDGGGTTLSPEQLNALCGEAKQLGLRTLVHAHSEESIRLATLAGCSEIEHGIFATPAVMRLMAEHGTYFDPQCGLIFRNYLSNRAKYEGVGNFNEAGFAAMQRAIPLAAAVVHQASLTPNLHMVWGTDAVAGAHGHNVDDLVCRVKEGGQPAMAALVSAMSGGAQALGLGDQIGSIGPGYVADIIATQGDPSMDIESLHHVRFVMRNGRRLDDVAR